MAFVPPALPPANTPTIQWIEQGESRAYTIRPVDREWFIRAIWKEGKPRSAVAYTLIQRFALTKSKFPTLENFVRSYSQPINPGWLPDGAKHKAAIERFRQAGKQDRIVEETERAKNRAIWSATPIDKIPSDVIEFVDSFFRGEILNPVPQAEHFCKSFPAESQEQARSNAWNYARSHHFGNPIPIPHGWQAGNWFFARRVGSVPRIAFVQSEKSHDGSIVQRSVSPGNTAAATIIALAVIVISKSGARL